MTSISNITNGNSQSITKKSASNIKKAESKSKNDIQDEMVDVYEPQKNERLSQSTYTPDLEKVKAMKEETDRRLFELFKSSISENFSKQSGGLRGVVEKLLNGEEVSIKLEINITEEDIIKAKDEISDDGYWGVEQTSERFINFAKALSGGDPSKIELLKNSFIEGYEAAKDIWGDELPEISRKTYEATLNKFEEWENE